MPKKDPDFVEKIKEQMKDISPNTDAVKKTSSAFASDVKDSAIVVGKGIAKGSAVVGKTLAEGSVLVGQGIKDGSILVGKGTVAAAKGVKLGVEKSVEGVKNFLIFSADKLHLKKPDVDAIDKFEDNLSPYLPTEIAKRWLRKNVKLKPAESRGKLVLKWTRVFCWYENPFVPKALKPIDDYFILEKKKKSVLNSFLIKKHPFGTIQGEEGSGKTMFLSWIHWELSSHHPEVFPCYLNASKKITEREMIKQLMYPFLNIYQQTVSRPFEEITAPELVIYIYRKLGKQPFFLLIDEPQNLDEKCVALLQSLEKRLVIQLVVGVRKDNIRKAAFLRGRKDALKFQLEGMSHEQAEAMLAQRIGAVGGDGVFPFDDQKIKRIVQKAKGNPLQILKIAKEKAIQLSIDNRKEIIAEIKWREEEKRQEAIRRQLEEKERRLEQKRKEKEDIQRKRIEAQRKEEERIKAIHEAQIKKEDDALTKIESVIGDILGGKKEEKSIEKKEENHDERELKKNASMVDKLAKAMPKEKTASEVLEEDPSLLEDLEQVFADTARATKGTKKSPPKKLTKKKKK